MSSYDKHKYYDKEIRKLPYTIIQQLAILLDNPNDNTTNWKALIAAMPDGRYDHSQVQQFAMAGMRMGGSPTETLLQDMGQKCLTVRQLIAYLERIGHSGALGLLKPDEPVQIIEQPQSQPVQEGFKVVLTCKAIGFPPPQYQWLKNGADLPYGIDNDLVIDEAKPQDEGRYVCIVTNRMGTEKSNVVVMQVLHHTGYGGYDLNTVTPAGSSPPRISQQPQSALIPIGHNFNLICHAKEPANYQWFKDGFRLHEQQLSELHFKPFQYQDEGNYSCRVYNTAGDALSAVATLQSIPNPAQMYGHGIPRCMHLTQTAADKIALVIGNRDYINLPPQESPLVHSCSDAQRLASILRKNTMNFKVISLVNLTKNEMMKALEIFCDLLGDNVYGLLYFAGHGFEEQGQNYMVPIDAERDWTPNEAVCVQRLFEQMHARGTLLNVFLLDICRKRAVTDTSFKMEKYSFPFDAQVVFGYATCPYSDAYERRSDSNGLYMKHLMPNITVDVKIEEVLHNVAADVENEVAHDIYVERQRPQFVSKTSRAFSLMDPIDPALNPLGSLEERSGKWLEIHRLPEKHILKHRGIEVEIRFEHTNWLSNVIVVCLRVVNLGEATFCDASLTLDVLPKDFQECHIHASTTNILRQVVPHEYRETVARTWKIEAVGETRTPVPVERISEIYNIQRLKKNLTLTIELKYELRESKESQTKYEIKAFNLKEFGIASAFAT